ncbi:MAG: Gfo/Idh/MocA family oxidoreductase [Myxococcales bacterium]|nr:Gfo/Idh/MocA family oxidoreductase [Myxococcales bacterium]
MNAPLRYGVIGTGMMGREHIQNLRALDGVEVAALCDPDEGSLESATSLLEDAVPCFPDHRALLEAGICDALVVASPNMTHADILLDIAPRGLPVLVEKPLCTTVADCRRVLEANRSGGMLWVGLEYRFIPAIAALVEKVASGAIGAVRMLAIREHRFPFLPKVGDWNRFNRNTGGTLVEKCCHFFDLMSLITGSRPHRVMASGAQDLNHLEERYQGERPDILDNAFVIVDFESGARGMLDLCMFAEATHNQEELSVVGDLGKLEAFVPASQLRVGLRATHRIGAVEEIPVEASEAAYQGFHHGSSFVEHLRFRDALRTGQGPEVGAEAGLWSVAVGVAAQRSISEARTVTLAEVLEEEDAG